MAGSGHDRVFSAGRIKQSLHAVAGSCVENIPEELREFYTPIITASGLICVSHCDPLSPHYHDCNGGECALQDARGPICMCPDTHVYSKGRCRGRLSRQGVLVGMPLTIAALVVIMFSLAIAVHRKKRLIRSLKEIVPSHIIIQHEEIVIVG